MKLVEYGVDYLTLTSREHVPVDSEQYRRVKATLQQYWYSGQVGAEQLPWQWNGYVGVKFGPLHFGMRTDGTILRVSGGAASYMGQFGLWGDWRATRVDVQATFVPEYLRPDPFIEEVRQDVQAYGGRSVGRPPQVKQIVTYGRGNSLYVGSRTSERFTRVYNKEAEQADDPQYRGAVRVECEYKGSLAEAAYGVLVDARDPNLEALRLVGAEARYLGMEFPVFNGAGRDLLVGARARSTSFEEKLQWLERTVGPAVRRLVAEGYAEDVLYALGVRIERNTLVSRGTGDILPGSEVS